MSSNKHKNTILSTLKYIISFNPSTNDESIQAHLTLLSKLTQSTSNVSTITNYQSAQIIPTFIDIINHPSTDTQILSQSITILSRILSHCTRSLFTSAFISNDGIDCIYAKLHSHKCNTKPQILNAIIDFLGFINKNAYIPYTQIVLNNTEYPFIFQIAALLKKNKKLHQTINKFASLLSKLYTQHNTHYPIDSDSEMNSDSDSDEDNNIKSILNTLIFTGFISTITKRTKKISSDNTRDIAAMLDIILILMECNRKKVCKNLLNSSIITRILQFIQCHKSHKHICNKCFEVLIKMSIQSSKHTRQALEANNYMSVVNIVSNTIKMKNIFLSTLNPQSISPSNEEKTFENIYNYANEEVIDISEIEMDETVTETESLTMSPKLTHKNMTPFDSKEIRIVEPNILAQPPPAQKQMPSFPSIPVMSPKVSKGKGKGKNRHVSSESEMEYMNLISDIQDTISNLQQNMDMKTPQIVKKYVSEHHAPRYSGIEAQHFIDSETVRIMAQRKAEEDKLKLTEIRECEETSADSESSNEEKRSMTHTHTQTVSKHNTVNMENGNDKLWNAFHTYYGKYVEAISRGSGDFVERLRNALQKLREFATNAQTQCIDGLLHCVNNRVIIVQFLSCLEVKDDVIRECIVEILDNLYDIADDNFIKFTNENEVIQYLSKSLLVRHRFIDNKESNNDLFQLSAASSARVDMKILQVLAVNFSGNEILYHSVFNTIKESIISPYQHIDFVLYALQVIKTIIEDADNARKWINKDGKGNTNMEHTTQFAVYVIETYNNSEAALLAKGILQNLQIDINKAVRDSENENTPAVKGKHSRQISNFYKELEKDALRKSGDLEYQKLRQWILYIQQECDNSRINNGILNDNQAIVNTLNGIKQFFMSNNGANNNEFMWKQFKHLSGISVVCDLITIILMGNNALWNTLLIGILDIIVLYIRRKDNGYINNGNDNGYIIKCMIDVLLRYLSISSKINKVMMKACAILDKMSKENEECISYVVDYGGIECIFNVIISWNSNHFNKSLMISSLNVLSNLLQNGNNNKNTQIIINNGGCQHLLNILTSANDWNDENDNHENEALTEIIIRTFQLLLHMTNDNGSGDITSNLILVLINQYSILTVLYSMIELLQKDKKTLYLLMELLLNMCGNCSKLSMDVQSWIVRIVLEFSDKYEKSPQIHQFMIRIVTAILAHNPQNNIQLILQNNSNNHDIIHILECMKMSQYKESIICLVFDFLKIICHISNDLNNYLCNPSKSNVNVFKFIVHVMKNWYLNEKENVESKVLIVKNCCQIITKLCNSTMDETNANIANQSHVTSSLIKLFIAHTEDSQNKDSNAFQDLQRNPYLNRISMFICILESINALCKTEEIALKIAKHAIKTVLKTVEYHILSEIGNTGIMNDTYNKQQKKVLLLVIIAFCTNVIQLSNGKSKSKTNIASYLIKYEIGKICYLSIAKYHSENNEDLTICAKLIDFLTLLLDTHHKAYHILESNKSDMKTSKLIAQILSKQTQSYRSYQPLIESCNNYTSNMKKCVHKINNISEANVRTGVRTNSSSAQSHTPIAIIQSTTANSNANSNAPSSSFHNPNSYYPPQMPALHNYVPQNMAQMNPQMMQQMMAMQNMSAYHMTPSPISPQQQMLNSMRSNLNPSSTPKSKAAMIKMFENGSNPYHTLNTHSPMVWNQNQSGQSPNFVSDNNSQNEVITNKLHSTLVHLLSNGTIMTKYPSIHTDTPNYLSELNKMKSKFKLVRISSDWQTIEFHNIPNQNIENVQNKPPKVLPIGNMRYIDSSFTDNNKEKRFSKSKHSTELLIYALDKNGKEIVIRLICQNINDCKRWTRALNQIINYFKQ